MKYSQEIIIVQQTLFSNIKRISNIVNMFSSYENNVSDCIQAYSTLVHIGQLNDLSKRSTIHTIKVCYQVILQCNAIQRVWKFT